jgi:hypothetical protein
LAEIFKTRSVPSVLVVIAGARPDAAVILTHAPPVGSVGERAVAVVDEQRVGNAAPTDDEEVGPTVSIEITRRPPRA